MASQREHDGLLDQAQSAKSEFVPTIEQELEILSWPRCLSAVPADVLDLIE
ncbi:hypothetical protein [Amycolatopsis vastitatis]|uniref:hypothetical protein n=1 Tax=Amycolatopsis vastitatis TaxID=1905142 RepID=UPI0013043CB9|nr:hypothetical protein [Amycolatopsis vastitatis]